MRNGLCLWLLSLLAKGGLDCKMWWESAGSVLKIVSFQAFPDAALVLHTWTIELVGSSGFSDSSPSGK